MQLVDMVCSDMVRILLGLLVLTAIGLAEPDDEATPDLKRMPQPEAKAEPWASKPSEKRSDQYVDEYESTEERIELDHSPLDSQRHKPQLQDEYHEKQTIEYLDDDKSKSEVPEKHKEEPIAAVNRYFVREEDPHENSPSLRPYQKNHDVIYQREQPRQYIPSPKEHQSNTDIYDREQPQEHDPSPKEYHDKPETGYKREPVHEDYYDSPDIVYKPEPEQIPSPKYYHDVPESVYKKRHYQNQKDKTRRPSTYQYEVDSNDNNYRYPKRPSSETYQPPSSDAYTAYEKQYPAHKYQVHIPGEHGVNLKEERHAINDHDGYRNPNADKDSEYHSKHVILPQTGHQNVHVYPDENPHYHVLKEQDYPIKERHVVKYDYDGENKVGYAEPAKDAPRHVPVSHQYIHVIEEPHQPISGTYEKENSPYVHRPIAHLRPESQPHSVVVLGPRNQAHPPQHEVVYAEREHEQPRSEAYHVLQRNHPVQYEDKSEAPKISHRESSRHASRHDESQPFQKAVLELNSDVYKEFLENKSPGRIVAIPVNQLNNGHSDSAKSHLHPVSEKPHGVLHIPLDGKSRSTIDLKNLPLVLQIPGGKDANYQKPQRLYQERVVEDKVPIIYAHASRSPVVSVPKSSGRLNKNKEYEKSKWIPMTPSWRNKLRRKSEDDESPAVKHLYPQESRIPRGALRLSDGGIYHILESESQDTIIKYQEKTK
ncbi:hypothetical protein HNY73_013227 [Argiope bruennichi]|uniref:Uncharacterized protein n=1 Tax=Argiope bruennichi TaxID=94029 RepID=A0A8T0EXB8_ARGBR|nr:hypothetical protein HNY73_013227 [Argiope bruennichi]